MRVDGDGHDADGRRGGGSGRRAVVGGGVLRRRRGHRSQAAHRRALRARDHGGGRVPPLARLLCRLLRTRAGAARYARER